MTRVGLHGHPKVVGTRAPVSVETVQGQVTLKDAKGRIEVHSVNEGVRMTDTSGELVAETVNGDVTLVVAEETNATVSLERCSSFSGEAGRGRMAATTPIRTLVPRIIAAF